MAIDLGTTKLAIIIARETKKYISIEAIQSFPYALDIQMDDWNNMDIVSILSEAVIRLKDIIGVESVRTILGIPGYHTGILENSYSIDIDGGIITSYHISKAVEGCGKYPLPDEWHILQTIPKLYTIDEQRSQVDVPIDMQGRTLTVNSSLVCINQEFVSKLTGELGKLGIHVDYVRPTLLSSGNVFLTETERQNGGILIDIGGRSTDIIIYRGGVPVYTDWIPVGGFNITSDLSIGMDIPFKQAEELKGQCILGINSSNTGKREQLYMPLKIGEKIKDIPLNYIQEIAELRVEEIFELIVESIDSSNVIDRKKCSAVLIGGGVAPIKGAKDFASVHLGCSNLRIGQPHLIDISNVEALASTYALIGEQAMEISSEGVETEDVRNRHIDDERISIKDRIIGWLSAFFNK